MKIKLDIFCESSAKQKIVKPYFFLKNKMWSNNTPPLSCCGQKLKKFADEQSQSRSPQYQCTHQIWWKSTEIYSSYCPESKIQMCCRQITLSKIDKILPLVIPKQMSTISMHTLSFCENPLTFSKVIIQKWKYGCVPGRYLYQKLTKLAYQQSKSRFS